MYAAWKFLHLLGVVLMLGNVIATGLWAHWALARPEGEVPAYAAKLLIARGGLKLIVPPELLAIVFAGTILMCIAAAMISFRKVAGIDPALVFRT